MTHRTHPLQDKVAIVIDAAHGAGAEIARHLAHAGARVVLHHRPAQRQAAQKVEEEIFAGGGRAWAVPADPYSETDIRFLLEQTAEGFDEPDIIVSAGEVTDGRLAYRFGAHADKVWMLQAPSSIRQSCGSASSLAADVAHDLRRTIDAAMTRTLLHAATEMEKRNMPARHLASAVDDTDNLQPRRSPCGVTAAAEETQTVLAAARLGARAARRRRFSIRD